jgi:hypothetical protein
MLLCQGITPATNSKANERPVRKHCPNSHQTLSDHEDEAKANDTVLPTKKMMIDLTKEPSILTSAFDAGISSLSRQTAVNRKESPLVLLHEREQDIAQSMLDQEMLRASSKTLTVKRLKSKASESPVKSPSAAKRRFFQHVQSKNNIEYDDREGGAIAFVDDPQLDEPISKGTPSQARKSTSKSTKKLPRRVQSKAAAAEPASNKGPRTKGNIEAQPALERKEQGPWTAEAMDLFDWRPPDWEERLKK